MSKEEKYECWVIKIVNKKPVLMARCPGYLDCIENMEKLDKHFVQIPEKLKREVNEKIKQKRLI